MFFIKPLNNNKMSFKKKLLGPYSERNKIIKRVILWAVIIGGILALFFVQNKAGSKIFDFSFFGSVNLQAQENTVIDPCSNGIGIGCLEGTDSTNRGRGGDAIVSTILDIVFFLIYTSAAVAVLFIVIAAFQMITANGDEEKYKSSLKSLQYAVIGLVMAIFSVTIVFLISQIIPGINLFR